VAAGARWFDQNVTRLARWGVGGAAILAVALAVAPAPAGAEPVDESGYWWRLQAVAGSPLAPPGVEPGQLYVAADAAGTSAVSAVRVAVGTSRVDALVLAEAASSGAAELRACPTSGWSAPEGAGALADRPPEDRCADEAVAGVRADDGTWSFAVGALVTEGVLDLVIVPGAGDQSVTFDAPDAGAIALAPPAPAPTPPATTGAPAPSVAAPPVVTAPAFAAPSLAAPSGVPASSFERDVDAYPAPGKRAASSPTPIEGDGSRAPLALVAVAIPVAAWVYRTRAALAGASGHVLAQPLRVRGDALASAAAVATESDEHEGASA
jgi:hypothetical protein